jgi:hypothetical protein
VGRSDELREIAQSLDNCSQVAITSAVKSVTGMGGVGKTELALQYALQKFRTEHRVLQLWDVVRPPLGGVKYRVF